MGKDTLTPTEASKLLAMETAKLRKFVAHFPHLFSPTARLNANRRYTEADIAVFRRVREVGDRLSMIPPDRPPAADSLAHLEAIRNELSALEIRVGLDYLSSVDRMERIQQMQQALSERIGALEQQRAEATAVTREYRRKPRSRLWHWAPTCRDYPSKGQYLATLEVPDAAQLCGRCKSSGGS